MFVFDALICPRAVRAYGSGQVRACPFCKHGAHAGINITNARGHMRTVPGVIPTTRTLSCLSKYQNINMKFNLISSSVHTT